MKLGKFLAKSKIIDLKSNDFKGALRELLNTASENEIPSAQRESILEDLLKRENGISTYLGNGICMPHTKVASLKNKYVFFVGRCAGEGLDFNDLHEYKEVKLVFMLLANPAEDSYLNVLNALARVFLDAETVKKILSSKTLSTFKNRVLEAFMGSDGKRERVAKANKVFLNSADFVAKGSKCSAVVIMGDTFENGIKLGKHFKGMRRILVSEISSESFSEEFDAAINVRAFSKNRMSQLRSTILMGLTKGILRKDDKLCCIGGLRGSDRIDTIVVVDIQKDFSHLLLENGKVLPDGVLPEVVERIVDIATELSVEGREGKPVGSLFLVGEIEKLKPYLKQLILNPFYGYKPEDRNILSPFMDETVKEYSMMDGAFVVDGSGVLESAGTLIHAPDFELKLPGGLGARHAAAYSISVAVDCMAFTISASTGQLTLFRKGQMIPLAGHKDK